MLRLERDVFPCSCCVVQFVPAVEGAGDELLDCAALAGRMPFTDFFSHCLMHSLVFLLGMQMIYCMSSGLGMGSCGGGIMGQSLCNSCWVILECRVGSDFYCDFGMQNVK